MSHPRSIDDLVRQRSVSSAEGSGARLITPGSYRPVVLLETSRTGARVSLPTPPSPGTTALLRWNGQERLCTVTRCEGSECEIEFEQDKLLTKIEDPDERGNRSCGSGMIYGGEARFGRGMAKFRSMCNVAARPTRTQGSWSLLLSKPSSKRGSTAHFNTAEEMFFWGSPVAHVLDYQEIAGDEGRKARMRLPVRRRAVA